MQAHYPTQYHYMNRFCYLNGVSLDEEDSLCDNRFSTLEEATEAAIDWAERIIKDREELFRKQIYR